MQQGDLFSHVPRAAPVEVERPINPETWHWSPQLHCEHCAIVVVTVIAFGRNVHVVAFVARFRQRYNLAVLEQYHCPIAAYIPNTSQPLEIVLLVVTRITRSCFSFRTILGSRNLEGRTMASCSSSVESLATATSAKEMSAATNNKENFIT